jgi:dTDP-glucose 4,6-dehydratase
MTLLVTGGAGFIGSNFVLDWFASPQTQGEAVVTLDVLTYAGNPENLAALQGDARHTLVQGDICDRALVDQLLATHRPLAIVHFAAESHVDRSIHGPGAFIRTNVEGTFKLLEAALTYWSALEAYAKAAFRFRSRNRWGPSSIRAAPAGSQWLGSRTEDSVFLCFLSKS